MKKVCIVTNFGKDTNMRVTNTLKGLLYEHGVAFDELGERTEGDDYRYIDKKKLSDDTDCIIVLGGDGTLIGVARDVYGLDIPLLGVNLGTLGYLTEVEVHNMKYAVEQLAGDRYTLERRMLLFGSVLYERDSEDLHDIALNDIVIGRLGHPQLINIKLFVNGRKLHSYDADGLIISTPTGSTAYNLSAGGPIVEPTASLVVITPICSHELGLRSIVLSADDTIEAEIGPGRKTDIEEACVTFDGQNIVSLKTGDRIQIRKAEKYTNLVNLNDMSFLETLRRKMSRH